MKCLIVGTQYFDVWRSGLLVEPQKLRYYLNDSGRICDISIWVVERQNRAVRSSLALRNSASAYPLHKFRHLVVQLFILRQQ